MSCWKGPCSQFAFRMMAADSYPAPMPLAMVSPTWSGGCNKSEEPVQSRASRDMERQSRFERISFRRSEQKQINHEWTLTRLSQLGARLCLLVVSVVSPQ